MYIRLKRRFHALRLLVVAALLVTGILLGSASTLADDLQSLQDQSAALARQQAVLHQQMGGQWDQLSSEKDKKAALDHSMDLTRQQIALYNTQISMLNAQISSNERDIANTEKRMDANRELYNQRVRAMYEAGSSSYIDILLSAKDFTDFLSRAEMWQVISKHDTDLFNSMKQDEAKLKTAQASLNKEKAGLLTSRGSLAANEDILKAQQAQQDQIVSQLQGKYDSIQSQYDAVGQQKSETDAEINAEIAREAAAHRGDNPTADTSYVISYAETFIGVPYSYGSANPRYGFDCSGFTQYVFANAAGIALTHSAYEQSQVGTPVSSGNLRPGDLVFFDTEGGGVSHVGIYIGNDQFIASNSSTGVAISRLFGSSYWSNAYVSARRILN